MPMRSQTASKIRLVLALTLMLQVIVFDVAVLICNILLVVIVLQMIYNVNYWIVERGEMSR